MNGKRGLEELFEGCLQAPYKEAATGGGHYAFFKEGADVTVYFQHSVGREDWRHNLDFFAVRHTVGRERFYCHRGFLKVWRGMSEELTALVADARRRGAGRVLCVGYSHGAALAILAVVHLKERFPNLRIQGVGFGTPRVLWGRVPEGVKAGSESLFAVRNPPDFVTHLPPALLGYRTPLPMLTLSREGWNPFFAHAQEAYRRALQKNVKKL